MQRDRTRRQPAAIRTRTRRNDRARKAALRVLFAAFY
jgi:hypothetical protein